MSSRFDWLPRNGFAADARNQNGAAPPNAACPREFAGQNSEAKWDDDESMDDVLKDYFGKMHVPVVSHFPIGHVRFNATLPVGAMAELDAASQTLRILENPVTIP